MNDFDLKLLQTAHEISELDVKIAKMTDGEIHVSAEDKSELLKLREKFMEDFIEVWIETDRIEIREIEYPFLKDIVQQMREQYNIGDLWKSHQDKILDLHENGGILDRGTFLANYYDLKPPYVKKGTHIPNGLKDICNEARFCYVYGQYSACVALSRTVLEIVLKDKLSILETEKICFSMLLDKAKTSSAISKGAYYRAKKIIGCANDILHKAKTVERRFAYGALDHLVEFLEEIYLSS